MEFEAFFEKKKIDLKQLEKIDKPLFDQFKYEYALMGPKSFDHTKKYLFNKLRLKYTIQ